MENNKDIVRRQWYQELWDNWNLSTADELLTDDYRLHLPGSPQPLDRATARQVVAMFSVSFPDLKHTVHEMIGEGDTVAARWTVRGTHRGDFQGVAPTGNTVVVDGVTVHHLVNGRVSETWLCFDTTNLMQQLTVTAAPATAST